ncbi:hypothetical protein FB451DRAFT_1408622 [Mycena latifolia]|nr:hypothetical protein FB451DRAFT_1408622 [Mycena latifolia]
MTNLGTSEVVPGSWDPIWPKDASEPWPRRTNNNEEHRASHEASTAKIWSVYVAEAEKYDKALVESWRSNMDGMLIFAGLFSASLTAFIIESYKTLNADSGHTTVLLLRQISVQLAATTNGSSFPMVEPDMFIPPVTALICNALWFISLGLSLSCALIATLLEQWAREFLHRADMRSAPVIRARIFSFLYYGLKRFNMHVVVEVIPLLLHASLIFFFAGLVAFLMPVNNIMVVVSSVLLGLVVVIYSALTILPLFYLDCPYRTPLSSPFWRLLQFSRALFAQQCNDDVSEGELGETPSDSVVEAVFCAAKTPSEDRTNRDCRALVWTIKSLADETELEPFVAGIHDVLWGPHGRRHLHDRYIIALVSHPDVKLVTRIEGLLRSADAGPLSKEAATRRRIICLKALWAIATLAERDSPIFASFDLDLIYPLALPTATDTRHYALSALTVARWATFCAMGVQLEDALHLVRQYNHTVRSDTMPVYQCLHDLRPIFTDNWTITTAGNEHLFLLDDAIAITEIRNYLEAIHRDGPYLILVEYLVGQINFEPYEYESTRATLQYLPESPPSALLTSALDEGLAKMASTFHGERNPEMTRVDEIAGLFASFFRHTSDGEDTFPWGLCRYLHVRDSLVARRYVVKGCHDSDALWSLMAKTITKITVDHGTYTGVEQIINLLWHVAYATIWDNRDHLYLVAHCKTTTYESTLAAIVQSQHQDPATEALLKTLVVESLCSTARGERDETVIAGLITHSLLPADTAVSRGNIPSVDIAAWKLLRGRVAEARVAFLADFLEICGAVGLFDRAASTVHVLGSRIQGIQDEYTYAVHTSHQIRLAKGLRDILQKAEGYTDSIEEFLMIFSPPHFGPPWDPLSWVDNPTARTIITESLDDYITRVCQTTSGAVDSELKKKLKYQIRGWRHAVAEGNHNSL